ncbi:Pimeloyl-ACP methyl ester carboxylesterase [Microbulbifer donghaiensis]|uniref:Pimeloyl-ACP methyl ester carboxylesterase n=1 Tax=Microbulbifer donghaiensis TaxID=494016 RepID=A0A1M4XB54_9GAMM|nr:alpha/beta hydrolase [Microbulbifer donghaiensis]SHE90635.1 Pimeloyl-ACP methyl ester carboxylesterase [Microbulbifer donghaiensis]
MDISLEFDGKTVAARQWGSADGVPVLALHGWLDNCASFDRLAPLLGGLNLVAVDMAGHGRSYHRSHDANYNIWEEAEDVLGVAHALGWRKFSLLAHSRGAVAAMITAGAFPDRIERLALIDGLVPPPAEDAEAPEILARAIAQRARYGARKPRHFASFEEAVEARKNGMFPLSDSAARALTERGTVSTGDGVTWSNDPRLMATSTAKLNGAQVKAFLGRATMPIRLVLAEDGIVDMIKRLRPALAEHGNIEVKELPGGHHLHMEEGAEAIAEWFGPFLRGEG